MSEANDARNVEKLLANVVREVLACPGREDTVFGQATLAGYSRAHWTRMFSRYIGEPPGTFLRRIRLERAAWLLQTTATPVDEIGASCGYRDASAFSRAFRKETGTSPAEYRLAPRSTGDQTVGIHWLPLWDHMDSQESAQLSRRFPLELRIRASFAIAAVEFYGSYARIGEFLGTLAAKMRAKGYDPSDRTLVTIYYDSIWTHPSSRGMRSHLGFRLSPGEDPPVGFERVEIRAGTYATFEYTVARTDRNEAWAWMSRHRFASGPSYDEYEGFPLPWEASKTRIWTFVR